MWLIGLTGSGKTTVGREVASRVGARFYDTDRMIEEMSGKAIAAIWDEDGEAGFRELESAVVASVAGQGVVAAAGGGAILNAGSRRHMAKAPPVVWLTATPARVLQRLAGDHSRPLLDGEMTPLAILSKMLEQRSELYAEMATDIVETAERTFEEVVGEVVSIWPP